ncbi:MAG TPA: tetratricopeptide repeat protein [Thioalkalivibrio sp.]|nr:tetratricopeptide repeat protein [Thioalkalivibrio sp.]
MTDTTDISRLARLAALLLALTAVGCATAPAPTTRDPGTGASPAFRPAPSEAPATPSYPLSPAAATLVARGDALLQAGEAGAAIAELERALRIEPRNPRIWQRMAVARLELDDPEQAEALARRSNRLAIDNLAIQSLNWRLIAEARRMLDDQAGYEAAMNRSAELQGR